MKWLDEMLVGGGYWGWSTVGIGDGGLTTVGEGEGRLMASANDDNCNEMVDKGIWQEPIPQSPPAHD
jgi:hypothetical protein